MSHFSFVFWKEILYVWLPTTIAGRVSIWYSLRSVHTVQIISVGHACSWACSKYSPDKWQGWSFACRSSMYLTSFLLPSCTFNCPSHGWLPSYKNVPRHNTLGRQMAESYTTVTWSMKTMQYLHADLANDMVRSILILSDIEKRTHHQFCWSLEHSPADICSMTLITDIHYMNGWPIEMIF